MAGNYKTKGAGVEAIDHAETIAAGDIITKPTRALWIGIGGDLEVTLASGSTATFANVQDGTMLPLAATELGSGTTASEILALR